LPEWLIERGIGETRAALVEDGRIVEARILREGMVSAGTVLEARLRSVGRNPIAVAEGQEYLLPKGAPGVTEGARLNIEVTREALGGSEPWKRPLARMTDEAPHEGPSLQGCEVVSRQLDDAGWPDLIEQARTGTIQFPGGELRVSVTPAMTLIDVDGYLPPVELAIASAKAAVETIRRHGIGGSIGIDFPTVSGKAERQAIGQAIDDILPRPFERTAINGFGFMQIVRPRTSASLFELAVDRAAFEARDLLRRATWEVGAIRLVGHPAVIAVLEANTGWVERLARQVGGAVALRAEPAIAMSAGHAERP
jgi:hypothetical protein